MNVNLKRWEYLRQKNIYVDTMNELGSEGWELVSVTYVHRTQKPAFGNIRDTVGKTLFFFKRELTD